MVRMVLPELDFDRQVRVYANIAAVRIARDDGFDGIAGKPFIDYFHSNNDNGGVFCLESWSQFRARRE